ncbi:hypothetical protein [Bordetella petrii]|uniref:hypothetical protein n=1 Tax=Bordetella petrii TaxID=94624 RepID=UPI0004AD3CBA|nr:hypothetical protein [Bordetella petrii]
MMSNLPQAPAAAGAAAARKPAATGLPMRYRVAVLYRFVLALAGGYACGSFGAMAIATAFSGYRGSAAMSATLAAFSIQTAAFIWVFMVRSTLKATLGIVVFGALMLAIFKSAGG